MKETNAVKCYFVVHLEQEWDSVHGMWVQYVSACWHKYLKYSC